MLTSRRYRAIITAALTFTCSTHAAASQLESPCSSASRESSHSVPSGKQTLSHAATQSEATPPSSQPIKKYFCTVGDATYYPWVLNLIGSIHASNWNGLEQIAVYDLGFTAQQREQLERLAKVAVCDLEMVHPDLKKRYTTTPSGKKVRGWYAWKPVVIKQALERFEYVLYVDAGTAILKPLDDLFNYIRTKGYFLLCDPAWGVMSRASNGTLLQTQRQFSIRDTATRAALVLFAPQLQQRPDLINQPGIVAGVQGVSRAALHNYIEPMYQLAHNLELFADDGSCPLGFGWGRHDQTLFSVTARLLDLSLFACGAPQLLPTGGMICCSQEYAHNPAIFFACKGQLNFFTKVRSKKSMTRYDLEV